MSPPPASGPTFDVFISYGREDADSARRLYGQLAAAGLRPWLDKEDIRPGEAWEVAVKRAVDQSRYFVALLSSATTSRRGWVQRELRMALDVLDEYPESSVYLIPARLDDCRPGHARLNDLHRVDLFPDWDEGVGRLVRAMAPETTDEQRLAGYLDDLRDDLALWRGLGLGRSVRLTDTYVSAQLGDRDRQVPEAELLAALTGGRREEAVVIEGPAGSGKTTLLRHWALELAHRDAPLVPVFLPLASVEAAMGDRGDAPLSALVARHYRRPGEAAVGALEACLAAAAADGRLLVMLDGADEVAKEARPMLQRWIDGVRRDLCRCPLVVSSRPLGILAALPARRYVVRPFEPDQQHQFVRNWFRQAGDETKGEDVVELLAGAGFRLATMAGNPLFLLMICVEHEVNGVLSDRPGVLLDRFARILLEQWDREKGVVRRRIGGGVPTDVKLEVLEAVAASTFDAGRRRFTEREVVEVAGGVAASVDPYALLDEIEMGSGLLVTNTRGECQFAHPLLQEFFVARHHAQLALRGVDQREWYAPRLFDDRFGNVLQYYDELTSPDYEGAAR